MMESSKKESVMPSRGGAIWRGCGTDVVETIARIE